MGDGDVGGSSSGNVAEVGQEEQDSKRMKFRNYVPSDEALVGKEHQGITGTY